MNNWDEMTNEELCVEYQKTRSEELFNYFYTKNKGLIGSEFKSRMQMFHDTSDDGELAQHGRIAMFQTMLAFNPDLGYKFSTIFHFYALKEKMDYRREHLDLEMPRHMYCNMEKANGDRARVTDSLDRPITGKYNVDDESIFFGDIFADPNAEFEDSLLSKISNEKLKSKMLDILRPREYKAIIMYFGLDDEPPKTLQEVGTAFNVTRERIRQVLEKALRKLHHNLEVSNYVE